VAKKVSKAEFKHSMRKRMVDVSQTKFDAKSKRVTDAKGNLFTGAVDMGGGRTQTYEKGRRVTVSKKMKGFRDAPKKTSGGGVPEKDKSGGKLRGGDALSRSMRAGSAPRLSGKTTSVGGVTPRGGKTDARTKTLRTTTPAPSTSRTRASSAPSYGGRAGGTGPVGTGTQQKISQLKNRIAATKNAYARNQARASRDAKAAAQARQDLAVIRQLEAQLKKLQ